MTGPVKGQQLPQGRTRCVSSNSYRTDGHTDRQDGRWTGSWVDRRGGGREGKAKCRPMAYRQRRHTQARLRMS